MIGSIKKDIEGRQKHLIGAKGWSSGVLLRLRGFHVPQILNPREDLRELFEFGQYGMRLEA